MSTPVASPERARRRQLTRVLALALLTSAGLAARALGETYVGSRRLELARSSGWLALAALLATLSLTPLARLHALRHGRTLTREALGGGKLASTRRALGVSCGVLAGLHAALSFFGMLRGTLALLWAWPYLRAGACGLAILAVLTATSFTPVVRALRLRTWKELHRLAYAAAAFALLHVLLSGFAPSALALAALAACLLLAALRLVPVVVKKS